jgi:hypothetical protein
MSLMVSFTLYCGAIMLLNRHRAASLRYASLRAASKLNATKTSLAALCCWGCLLSAPASAQYNGSSATPGNCWVAISKAQQNNNVWPDDTPFSANDCRAVAGKMIDDGYKDIERSEQDN